MTRDKLMALRRTCPKCNGSGLWHEIYINGDGLADEDGGACETCLGTGYVLPATAEVLGNAEPRTVYITEPVCISPSTVTARRPTMPDERTCRTCWHWDVIEPGQGLCGHPATGGAVHGAEDTCCNHLATVGRGGDWQPHEQLSGGSAPAEDWREPMVDTSSSSNPTEEHVGKHLLTGGLRPEDVEPDPRAILAERDLLKQRVAELEAENERLRAALELERRAVEALAEHIEIACEGFAHGSMSAMVVAPGGYMDAADIAAWARARAERGE